MKVTQTRVKSEAMNIDIATEARHNNWNTFCNHHMGDWHGIWNKYSSNGEVIESFKCIRSFHVTTDGSEVNHENHYIYSDGKSETKTFGQIKRPITKALYLDNSFSWGSTKVETNAVFGFETGFRHKEKRISAGAIYESNKLQQIIIISEHLGSYANVTSNQTLNSLVNNSIGKVKTITPNLIISSEVEIKWKQPENLCENNFILHSLNGISISCPRQVTSEKEMLLIVDWLANPTILQRGIRHFDEIGFTRFSLQTFTLSS